METNDVLEAGSQVSLIDETLSNGLDPIEMLITPVISPLTHQPCAYRTELRINSVELGVLTPGEYDPVASRTSQCVALALWNFRRVCDLAQQIAMSDTPVKWISVRVPPRILTKGSITDLIEAVLKDSGLEYPDRICFEFPRESVFSDTDAMTAGLEVLRKYGIKSAIRGFGDEFCPAPRLASLPFDFVLLDETVLQDLVSPKKGKSTEALLGYISTFGTESIAMGQSDESEIEPMARAGVWGYTKSVEEPITESELITRL